MDVSILVLVCACACNPKRAPQEQQTESLLEEPFERWNRQQVIDLPPVRVPPPALGDFGYEAILGEHLTRAIYLEERMARFLPDGLRETTGTTVQRTGPGQASPILHGFTGFRTLYVLDGFRFNNSTWRDGPNQYLATIDSELIETMEVRYGSGGVRYGPDAAGGTVVMETRPAGSFVEGQDHSAAVALRLASADQSWIAHTEAGGNAGAVAYRFGFTDRNFSDLEGGRHVGLQEGTAWSSYSIDGKLAWRLAGHSQWEFGYQQERQFDVPRTHRTVDGVVWHGTVAGTELEHDLRQYRDFTYTRVDWRDGGFFDRVQAGIGFHSSEEMRDRTRSDGRSDEDDVDVDTIGGFVNFENLTNAGNLRYGADYYRDQVDSSHLDFNADGSFASRGIQGAVADDALYDLYGAFFEDDIDLSERWSLLFGGRWSAAGADADSVQDPATGNRISIEDDYSALSAEARLLHRFTPETSAHFALFRSVRMPNLSDLTRLDVARSNELETPSPGLEEEIFTGLELGLRHLKERYTLEGGVYYTFIEDLIVRFPTGNVVNGLNEVEKANAGEGHVYGVDLNASVRLNDAWTVGGDFAYVFGVVDAPIAPVAPGVDEEEPLSRLPPARGSLRIRYEPALQHYFVEGLTTVADDQDRLSASDAADTQRIPVGGTPGYTVYTLRGGLRVGDGWTLGLAVENLTNRDYRIHGSGVNEPGTNVVFSARWQF